MGRQRGGGRRQPGHLAHPCRPARFHESYYKAASAGQSLNDEVEEILKFKEELKLFLENFIYLATCLSVLETYRSLVLLQFGINQFAHGYFIAVSAGLVMGKLTTLSRRIKLFGIFDNKPLIWSALYRSTMMTVFVILFKTIEELVFKSGHEIAGGHALVLTITHFTGTMFVFMVLFIVRGLEQRLGEGKLKELFFSPPSSEGNSQ